MVRLHLVVIPVVRPHQADIQREERPAAISAAPAKAHPAVTQEPKLHQAATRRQEVASVAKAGKGLAEDSADKEDSVDLVVKEVKVDKMMDNTKMETIQLSLVTPVLTTPSMLKFRKHRSVAKINNILDIMLMLTPNVKFSTFVPIIKRTIFFVPTEQYSTKNISCAFGGINSTAVLLQACTA